MKTVERQRLGADAWRKLMAKFSDSGLSVRAFCVGEGISHWTFNRWRKRLNDSAPRQSAAKQGATVARGGFVDLGTLSTAVGASKSERVELRLDLGDGLTLHLVRG